METQGRMEDFVTSASNTGKDEHKQSEFAKRQSKLAQKEVSAAKNFNFDKKKGHEPSLEDKIN